MSDQHTIRAVARIRSDFPTKFGIPRQSGLVAELRARVIFEPACRSPEAVRGLEDFSHIWLIWQFSQALREGWSPTVRPPRLGGNRRLGVFASRSPFRPNALGLSCVRLEGVELDKALLPMLAETMAGADRFTLIPGDILKLDVPALVDQHFQGLTPLVCANLPYNITTPVLRVLASCGRFEAMTVMIQREVALRLAARPGTGDYGAFTVFMQYYSQPEILFDVPPDCFLPAPKVTSAVVRCRMRQTPAVSPACGQDFFFRTVRAAFAQRRKTLANSLASVFGLGRERIAGAISACGLSPTVRGEVLGLEELANLADRLWEMTGEQDL